MRLKQRIEDFRVRELLAPDVVGAQGDWAVYRVTKRKLTSLEAAARVAQAAGVPSGEVSMAGLKDRQGVTIQHMALHGGRPITLHDPDLRVETIGRARAELDAEASEGNAFELVLRALDARELALLRTNLAQLREHGLVNYFGDQRFGNLRHGQGWIARELMHGEPERALRALLTGLSQHDDRESAAFKLALGRAWGDWAACRDVAGRFGAHHSVFEHLKRNPDDFAGAFQHVSTRLRLIHLYAFQSHLWNRAVAEYVRLVVPPAERIVIESVEGPLVFPSGALPLEPPGPPPQPAMGESFRLPGERLADVEHPLQRALLEDALAAERMVPAEFTIQGVPGFQIKGEDRPLLVRPRHLRVRPAEPDPLNWPLRLVKVRFELPRGAYATLVVQRLVRSSGEPDSSERRRAGGARADRARGPDRGPRGEQAPRQGGAPRPERGERADRARGPDRGPQTGGPRFDRPPRAGERGDADRRGRRPAPGGRGRPGGGRSPRRPGGGEGRGGGRPRSEA